MSATATAEGLQSPPKAQKESSGPTLPQAIEAEKSLLGSMLNDAQRWVGFAVEGQLTEDDFYYPSHAVLYRVIKEFYDRGEPVELVALNQLLEDRKLIDSIGGRHVLVELASAAPTSGHFSYHLNMVRQKSTLRRIITACTEAIGTAYNNPEEVADFVDDVEQRIFSIRQGTEQAQEQGMKELIGETIEILEQFASGERGIQGVATGYPDLDEMSSGLKPGEIFIIAARPSMGKTSFMMNLVEHVTVDQGFPSMVFSCEMSAQQLVQRLLFSRARFSMSNLKPGVKPTKGELGRIMKASAELTKAPMFIDDTPAIPIGDLRAKARRKKRECDIQLIAVDYLQLMRSKTRQAENSREREIAEISSGLKALAKELQVPIIVLAQLNRSPEQRGGTPRMSDLRESGSIEQDADLIGLLYRSEYYNDPTKEDEEAEEEESQEGTSELIIAKNRNGPTGNVPLTFLKALMRFESRAAEQGFD